MRKFLAIIVVVFVAIVAAAVALTGCGSNVASQRTVVAPKWGDTVTKVVSSGETTTFYVYLYTKEEADTIDWKSGDYDNQAAQVAFLKQYVDARRLHAALRKELGKFAAKAKGWSAWDRAVTLAGVLSDTGNLSQWEKEQMAGVAFVTEDDDLQSEVDALKAHK